MGPFKDIGVERTSHVATDASQNGPLRLPAPIPALAAAMPI
jgi:hypothetical protein